MSEGSDPVKVRLRYALLALATLAAGLAGYAGYVLYPRFHLPAVTGAGLLLLAAAAGIASFFSPCSFPLLLSLLARAPGIESQRRRGPAALRYGAALALGAALFLILAGLVIAIAGRALFAGVTFTSTPGRVLRLIVGLVLIFLGLVQLNRMPFEFRALEPAVHGLLRRQARFRHQHPVPGFFLFGFGYVMAGFGWTGPILAGLAGESLSVGGFTAAFIAFAVAALAIVALIFTLAAVIAVAGERVSRSMQASGPTVKRWGGRILIVVGAWFLILAAFPDFFAKVFPV